MTDLLTTQSDIEAEIAEAQQKARSCTPYFKTGWQRRAKRLRTDGLRAEVTGKPDEGVRA